MTHSKKIIWQKFEDLIDQQLNSPIVTMVKDHHQQEIQRMLDEEGDLNDSYMDDEPVDSVPVTSTKSLITMPGDISNEIYLSSSYDCWLAHTNFDITADTNVLLSYVPGVEVLKTLTRYRFFVGIGRAFDISDVRKDIEETLGKTRTYNGRKDSGSIEG